VNEEESSEGSLVTFSRSDTAKVDTKFANSNETVSSEVFYLYVLLPRFMGCRRGLAMIILSVRLSVCQTRGL